MTINTYRKEPSSEFHSVGDPKQRIRCHALAARHGEFITPGLKTLRPDVLLSDRTIAPFRYGNHPLTIFELADDARPFSRPELDRV